MQDIIKQWPILSVLPMCTTHAGLRIIMSCAFNCLRKDNSSLAVTVLQQQGPPEQISDVESSDQQSANARTPYYISADHRIIQDVYVYDDMIST